MVPEHVGKKRGPVVTFELRQLNDVISFSAALIARLGKIDWANRGQKGQLMDVRIIVSQLYFDRDEIKEALRSLERYDPLSARTVEAVAQSVIEIRKAREPDHKSLGGLLPNQYTL